MPDRALASTIATCVPRGTQAALVAAQVDSSGRRVLVALEHHEPLTLVNGLVVLVDHADVEGDDAAVGLGGRRPDLGDGLLHANGVTDAHGALEVPRHPQECD